MEVKKQKMRVLGALVMTGISATLFVTALDIWLGMILQKGIV